MARICEGRVVLITGTPDRVIASLLADTALARATEFTVQVHSIDPPHPSWQVPVHAYFKLEGSRWSLVGFERLPDGTAPRR